MNGLSIEKAKRYDKAIERAKGLIDFSSDSELKTLEYVFPELRESEDEKIRKDLIKWFKEFPDTIWRGPACQYSHYKKDVISWLKKQSEPININPSEFDSRLNKLLKQFESLPKEELITSLSFYLNVVQNDVTYKEENQREKPQGKSALEAIKEEKVDNANKIESKDYSSIDPNFFKATDKVEQKFKIGDWVVRGDTIAQILDIQEQYYIGLDINGKDFTSSKFLNDDKIHLWTIKDAKDGDVLVNGSNIFIFHVINDTRLMGYCHINTDDGRFYDDIGKNECFCLIDAVVNPATKEQCDTLMKAMADAGYTFDFDKKELKEIEDEEYNDYDYGIDGLWHAKNILEKTLGKVEGYQTDDGILDHKCAISAVDKLYKQKPAEWSEYDEKIVKDIIATIDTLYYHGMVNWLKSLKDRYTWKPSEEQIEALEHFLGQ